MEEEIDVSAFNMNESATVLLLDVGDTPVAPHSAEPHPPTTAANTVPSNDAAESV